MTFVALVLHFHNGRRWCVRHHNLIHSHINAHTHKIYSPCAPGHNFFLILLTLLFLLYPLVTSRYLPHFIVVKHRVPPPQSRHIEQTQEVLLLLHLSSSTTHTQPNQYIDIDNATVCLHNTAAPQLACLPSTSCCAPPCCSSCIINYGKSV